MTRTFAMLIGLVLALPVQAEAEHPSDAFIDVVRVLSADEMGGRAPGTEGNRLAREYLLEQIAALDVEPVGDSFEHAFARKMRDRDGSTRSAPDGINLLFRIDGKSGDTIVLTAHYDHVGIVDGEIYNGADDNASGVAGALAVAEHFTRNPPENTIVFALVDAEETGLAGARAFVAEYEDIDNVRLNINLDMISRSDVNELYAAGTFHYPQMRPLFMELAEAVPVKLLLGHDDPALGPYDDWTRLADHYAFFEKDIPFIYFGVEDHPDYHKPGDDFDKIPLDFFSASLRTVVAAAEALDSQLAELFPAD